MSPDDHLRDELRRDAALTRAGGEPGRLLRELRPAMRRARRRRITAGMVGATVLVGGTAAMARSLWTGEADSIRMTPADLADDRDATTSPDPGGRTVPVVVTVPPADGDVTGLDVPGPITATSRVQPDDEDDDDHGPPTSTTGSPAATGSTPPGTTPPTVPPSTTLPSTATPPSTVPDTSPVVERFDSACGSVWASRTGDRVVIVDVAPADGYTSRLEDPDHDGITVQFTGSGEDCELKIPVR